LISCRSASTCVLSCAVWSFESLPSFAWLRMPSMASRCELTSAVLPDADAAGLSVADGVIEPDVPAAPGVPVWAAGVLAALGVAEAGVCAAAAEAAAASGCDEAADGVAGLVSEAVLVAGGVAEDGAEAADGEAVPPPEPPAACSNSFRCVRNSTSFPRIAGSRPAFAPVVPVAAGGFCCAPVVAAGWSGDALGDAAPLSGPSSAFTLSSTFEYAAFQSFCVVISWLKFEISCETCVRVSPCSFDASGIAASWLRDSRASLRCCFAASRSAWPAGAADGCADCGSVVCGVALAGGCCSLCGVALAGGCSLCGVALGVDGDADDGVVALGAEVVGLADGEASDAGVDAGLDGVLLVGAVAAAAPAPGAPLMAAAISVT